MSWAVVIQTDTGKDVFDISTKEDLIEFLTEILKKNTNIESLTAAKVR